MIRPIFRAGLRILLLASLAASAVLATRVASSANNRPVLVNPVPAPRQDGETLQALLVEAGSLIRVQEARTAYGVDGSGLTVAVVDTGIRSTHRDFTGRVVAQVNYTSDNGGSSSNAADGDGHGTHVSGIIAADNTHTGMAPGADIAALKVLDNNGSGTFDAIASALDWVIANRTTYNISVVNLSLGDGGNYTSISLDSLLSRIRTLRTAGVAVCAAAGNDFYGWGSAQGMDYPAIFPDTVSVGAVYDANVGSITYGDGSRAYSTAADRLCPFSQRLHPNNSAQNRTDAFAPGADITSAGITSDTSSATGSGTSQATPMVAGVILLLQDYYKRVTGNLPTVDQLETWLRDSAVTVNDGDDEDDNVTNTGLDYLRIDAMAAIQEAEQSLGVAYSISGSVTESGSGLADVTVTAGSYSATTDSEGFYTISGMEPATYTVQPSKTNYTFTPQTRTVTLSANRTGIDFTAAKTAFSISGTVRMTNGSGLSGVTVQTGASSTVTNASGAYTLSGFSAGTHTVTPTANGYTFSPSSQSVTVGPDRSGVDFTGTAEQTTTYTVRGTVTLGGNGLASVLVSGGGKNAATASDGSYTLSGLSAGTYTITASRSGYTMTPASRTVTVTRNVTGVDFAAAQTSFTLSGTVRLNGPGFSGVTITAGNRSAVTDADGRYTLAGLTGGAYVVTPRATGYAFSPASVSVTLASDQSGVDFTASVAQLSIGGRVTTNGVGVGGLTVMVGDVAATTDSTGYYSVSGLDAGASYTVKPSGSGYVFSPTSRTVTLNSSLTAVDFTATPHLRISGKVTLDGVGVGGVTVSAGARSATTDSDGDYTLSNAPAGSYTVTPSGLGYAFSPASRTVTLSGSDSSGINFAVVMAPHLESLTPARSQMLGDKSTTVVVRFDRPVTAATTIILTSAHAQLKVPKKVVLARGRTSVKFKVTSRAVSTSLTVTVTGAAEGVTRETVITLLPKSARR